MLLWCFVLYWVTFLSTAVTRTLPSTQHASPCLLWPTISFFIAPPVHLSARMCLGWAPESSQAFCLTATGLLLSTCRSRAVVATMVSVVLGPGRNWSSLCNQSTRCDVGNVVVPWPSPETSPLVRNRWSASFTAVVSVGYYADRWGHSVSGGLFENGNFLFQKWMNIVSFCYFCVELIRAPKIMKIFVWPLWDVKYLGKILNVSFQYILNVIKIAQIN